MTGINAVDCSYIRRDFFQVEIHQYFQDKKDARIIKNLARKYFLNESQIENIVWFAVMPSADDFVMIIDMISVFCKELGKSEWDRNCVLISFCKKHNSLAKYYLGNIKAIMNNCEKFDLFFQKEYTLQGV